ncbi:pyrroline-5-carboxylate reductase [Carbonactinospora thermoautotrophica]|uniref:Pyrroline-5-carboxylate reductase n=1 Tax=Carbonactinospora thermoautotrophica TaxID=1469144 RepID=A0A132MMI0_9ACTN|nr:pyrroline-5-carboxylate reductase [Carbonactinospora thermoautotrophica]KWW97580.1 pyrroline-5-carboxylate reductase [Carbonactinospora thermoautotrophica]KWW98929.1 Pyrroline-5-carboxylate reductase [Carbonactinospora thermoautotrophica]KWX08807.1 pyrroline-5-carboxylate reductase [Carbonactinospora thermoautotrophica]
MSQRIAVIGAGKMGEALLSGMLRAGKQPGDLMATVRRAERAKLLRERYGIEIVTNAEAAKSADTLILAVKPQDMEVLLDELSPYVSANQLIVSVAAGITTGFIERRLTEGVPVVRVMSNTPVLVDEAMSAISPGAHAAEEHLRRTEEIFKPVGKTIRVPESQQDAVTALSGSGPAYFYYLVEAMTDAGLLLGLPRAVAHELVVQTAIGAAVMMRDSGEHPVILREAVTSPAGTTAVAVKELENHSVRAALIAALEAARNRSRELASGHE